MRENMTALVTQRQEPLRRYYKNAPEETRITDHAVVDSAGADPFHGSVRIGDGQSASLDCAIHRAGGGDHDLPDRGDILCGALAACLDSTLRMIAARVGVTLESLDVAVSAHSGVRGCLMVDRAVPAESQRIEVDVRSESAAGADSTQFKMLTSAAEQCCVVLQTLRGDVPITTRFSETAATTT